MAHIALRKGVQDVTSSWSQRRVQKRWHRHKHHALLCFHLSPVFKQKVMAMKTLGNHRGINAEMERQE